MTNLDRARYLSIVEAAVRDYPVNLSALSSAQRAALEAQAERQHTTPQAVLDAARDEVLASIEAERAGRAIALEVVAESGGG
ncbi:hypothetical protein [Leifsonia sp. AG29]|uniref:hypothetical protein n=1 Tax=Leifsonia sp. AG29 TaxID=2598860 RepID=UPI00131B2C99|nr:hypothetical protein [Leifsonia sp. AG29]